MKTAQAQPDFRLTEIMLSLNSGSEDFSDANFFLDSFCQLPEKPNI